MLFRSLTVAVVTTVGLGGVLFYNMNIKNRYLNVDDINRDLAELEQRYARFIGLPQPTLTDVTLRVDLYPSRNAMQVAGTYRYVNATSAPIAALHIRTLPGAAPLRAVSVPGATLVHDDKKLNYHIFQFDQPLQPGARGTMSFRTIIEKRGLAALPSDRQSYEGDAQPAGNGTYAVGQLFAPILEIGRASCRERVCLAV